MINRCSVLVALALVGRVDAAYGQTPPSFLDSVLAGTLLHVPDEGVPFYVEPGKPTAPQLERHDIVPKMMRSMVTVEVDGARSPVRISESRPMFLVKLAVPPRKDRDVIILVDSANGKRVSLLTITPGGMTKLMPGKQFDLESKAVGPNLYLIRPEAQLRPGEYLLAFGKPSPAYSFGIEPGAAQPPEPQTAPESTPAASAENPNSERLKKLDSLLAKGLVTKADYDTRKQEILHPPQPKPVTLEDRLKKLEDLLHRGLIGRPEYEKKRAEILSEI